MVPYASMIIFAIHAAIKLGQEIRSVYEEEIRDRGLFLPPVGFTPPGLGYWDEKDGAKQFFLGQGKGFVAPPPTPRPGEETQPHPPEGLFYDLWRQQEKPAIQEQLCFAYQKIQENIDPHRQEDDVKGDYIRKPEKLYPCSSSCWSLAVPRRLMGLGLGLGLTIWFHPHPRP